VRKCRRSSADTGRLPVDVVLLDLDTSAESPSGFIVVARNVGYRGRFLLLAGTADPRQAAGAIRLGAAGIFLKCEPPDRLVEAIRLVANGAVWLDQSLVHALADPPVSRLTDREAHVLRGILDGLSNRKIADHLRVSEASIKATLQQLFHKAEVRTRSQLVRAALEGRFPSSLSVAP
jgi:two-component system, NarL family, nitrate/nitrite response regulator NarL